MNCNDPRGHTRRPDALDRFQAHLSAMIAKEADAWLARGHLLDAVSDIVDALHEGVTINELCCLINHASHFATRTYIDAAWDWLDELVGIAA